MEHIQVVQNAQIILLWVLLIAVGIQLTRFIIKFKVHRKVYGKGIKSYMDAKTLEKEFYLNKTRQVDETK